MSQSTHYLPIFLEGVTNMADIFKYKNNENITFLSINSLKSIKIINNHMYLSILHTLIIKNQTFMIN